jgi:hypothetical protein
MLYYIKSYITSEPGYPVNHQKCETIFIDKWYQVIELDIEKMLEKYKKSSYEPYYILIKCENEQEKKELLNKYTDMLIDIDNLNIASVTRYKPNNNLFVISLKKD